MANHVDDTRFFHGGDHFFALRDIHREGFFAEDGLAVFRGFNGDFMMAVVWRADINDIDVGVAHDGTPIGRGMAPAQL